MFDFDQGFNMSKVDQLISF